MKILKPVDTVIDGVVTFVLRVLGAFGACWGTFSSISITYREFFGGEDDTDFMNNPIYAKTALGISTSAALLSAYVIARDKLKEYHAKRKFQEVDVTIPICNTFNIQTMKKNLGNDNIEMMETSESSEIKGPISVICKKKN